jgi:sortase A
MADEEEKVQAESIDSWEWVPASRRRETPVKTQARTPADPADPWAWVHESPRTETPARPAKKRRRRGLRASTLMIVAGTVGIIGLSGHFVGTCVYAHVQQNQLREELAAADPQTATTEAALGENDSIPVTTTAVDATTQAKPPAQLSAEARRPEHLAALEAAADAFAATVLPGKPIGRIVIPKIGVDVVMLEGTTKSFLREGPGHWPETLFPGQKTNFVVSGHRTSYGAPFRKLNEMKVGDEIDLVLSYVSARYTVTRVIIVAPDEMDKVQQLGREQVSLVACHPLYSGKQRILVQGELTGYELTD